MMRALGDFGDKPRERVIDCLRRHVPGVWKYRQSTNRWVHESGLVVRSSAQLMPLRYGLDGADIAYVIVYRREDTGALVHPFTGMGLV